SGWRSRTAATRPATRSISSAGPTGSPGPAFTPPMSMMSAPWPISREAASRAAWNAKVAPRSKNESGVRFTTAMTANSPGPKERPRRRSTDPGPRGASGIEAKPTRADLPRAAARHPARSRFGDGEEVPGRVGQPAPGVHDRDDLAHRWVEGPDHEAGAAGPVEQAAVPQQRRPAFPHHAQPVVPGRLGGLDRADAVPGEQVLQVPAVRAARGGQRERHPVQPADRQRVGEVGV